MKKILSPINAVLALTSLSLTVLVFSIAFIWASFDTSNLTKVIINLVILAAFFLGMKLGKK